MNCQSYKIKGDYLKTDDQFDEEQKNSVVFKRIFLKQNKLTAMT